MKNKELFLVQKVREMARQGSGAGVRLGIGDDAAVLRNLRQDQELLVTTDLVVEGSHFDPNVHPALALGHKALARGLSDIAAMGGQPRYVLLSLCLPPWADAGWQRQFFRGLFRLARRHRVTLVGGDLAAGSRFVADIVVLGAARWGRILKRGGAKTEDIIYVSGQLGGSALGLKRLRAGRRPRSDPAIRRHLYPSPRLALGRYLVEKLGVRAGIDLSDGLSIDLHRLAAESGLGAEIRAADIPIFPGATLDEALHGGEDYELLFAVDPRRKAPATVGGVPLKAIGAVTTGRRLTLVDTAGRRNPLAIRGFQHRVPG